MKSRSFIRGAAVVAAMGMLFSQAVLTQGASAASASGKVTVWLDDNSVNPCLVKVVTGANKNSKLNINIELKKDWNNVTKTAVAGGAGPDVIMTPGPTYTMEYAKAGALAPLDSYVKSFGWDKSFAPWALKLGVNKGKLYSLPSELETMLLWYNKTALDSLGVKVPKTTADLVAAADKVNASGIVPFASGNSEWKGVNEWFVSALFNGVAGPDNVYKALTGTMKWNSAPFLEAVNILNNFQQKGYIGGGLDRFYTKTFDEFLTEFANGKAAMNMEGSWRFENIDSLFKTAGKEWNWAPFPTKSGTELYSIGIGSSWAINNASKNKAGAAEFLKLLFDQNTQAKLAVECGMAPGPVTVKASLLKGLEPRKAALYTSIAKAANKGNYGYLTWTFWPPKSNKYIIEEIEKVWAKTITPAQYLDGLDKVYQEELKAKATPPVPKR